MPGPSMPPVPGFRPFLMMVARFCLLVAWYITNIWRRNPVESLSVKTGLLLNSLDGTCLDPILNGCMAALRGQNRRQKVNYLLITESLPKEIAIDSVGKCRGVNVTCIVATTWINSYFAPVPFNSNVFNDYSDYPKPIQKVLHCKQLACK